MQEETFRLPLRPSFSAGQFRRKSLPRLGNKKRNENCDVMKVKIIQQGDRAFIKTYFLGFIPLYWEDGKGWAMTGWTLIRTPVMDKRRAEMIVSMWKERSEEKRRFKSSPPKTLYETDI